MSNTAIASLIGTEVTYDKPIVYMTGTVIDARFLELPEHNGEALTWKVTNMVEVLVAWSTGSTDWSMASDLGLGVAA